MINFKKIFILIIIFILNFLVVNIGFPQERRNPFMNWFPIIKIEPALNVTEEEPIIIFEPEVKFNPSIYNVEGLIWGPYKPKAIINNNIYGIGDKLGEAEIRKIDREGVTLIFDEKEYAITTYKPIGLMNITEEE